MKYFCLDCKGSCESNELGSYSECVGEFWGSPAYQSFAVCPYCGSEEIVEAMECKVCGTVYPEDEIHGAVCDECLNKYKQDPQRCYDVTKEHKTEISINDFLAQMFTESEIEKILLDFCLERKVDCTEYVDWDKSWFGDCIIEHNSKN